MKAIKALSKLTGRTGLVLRKHSPEILLIAGVGGTVVSTVLACRATLKVDEVLRQHREKLDKIGECWEQVELGQIELSEYSEQDHKKDLAVTYTQTGVAFVKLYWPSITLLLASIACIVGSHGVMKKRNLGLIAAYKAVEEGFNAYRQRVRDEYGEEKDYIYKHGLQQEEVVAIEVDEDGKAKKVKKTKLSGEDTNGLSVYARFFDESSSEWSSTPEYNFMFLRSQQNYFNDILKARGHIFLNEVYETLGIPHSKAGAVCGWVIGDGDNFIDFGIFDGDRMKARDFVNGYEKSILLDFNVDGVIYDLI